MHDHHSHAHGADGPADRRLLLALALTLSFAFVEAIAGWFAGSLALIGDAGHMLTDSLALGIAAMAAALSRRPPTARLSFGLARSKALAAFTNALLMLILIGVLLWQAVRRLNTPHPVDADTVTVVALIGLMLNIVVAIMLSRGADDLNTRGALLHVVGDLLGSVAALASGVLIKLTGWMPIDALLAMLISGLIAASTVSLLRSAMHALLNGVPHDISLPEVGRSLASQEGVDTVHDLHIWALDDDHVALSAHIVVRDPASWPTLLPRLQQLALDQFGIAHVTFQPECVPTAPLRYVDRPAEDAEPGKSGAVAQRS